MATLDIFKLGKNTTVLKYHFFCPIYYQDKKKNIVLKMNRAQKVKKTKDIFTIYWIALVPTQKPHKIGLISVHT